MGILASDDFNRADAGLGANWTTLVGAGAPLIKTNRVQITAVGTDAEARYSNITWPNDQYAQVKTMTCTSANAANGAEVRCSSTQKTSYICWCLGPHGAGAHLVVRKSINSAHTTFTDTVETIVSGDVLRIVVQGDQVSAYINGVLKSGPTTDGAIASGHAGLIVFVDSGAAADSELDDFEGGDPGGAPGLANDYSAFPKQLIAERAAGIS